MSQKWLTILFLCFLCQYAMAQEEACSNCKVVLFEDFGGNDPSDQESDCYKNFPCIGMDDYCAYGDPIICIESSTYILTKRVGNNQFQWHLQDDHTHPYDYTRGYMLRGDRAEEESGAFYSASIKHLRQNQKLHISAYVANIMCKEMYEAHPYWANPNLRFVLVDNIRHSELASFSTGDIYADSTKSCDESAEWQLVTMEYEVPRDMLAVTLVIYDETDKELGNDFVIDDIEVRICGLANILAPDTVCAGTKNTFEVLYVNNQYLAEPLNYQWLFSSDSLTWETLREGNDAEYKFKAQPKHAGWYTVRISGADESEDKCVLSDPFKLHVIEDCPPVQCADGVLLLREDFGGNGKEFSNITAHEELYSTTIDDVCAGSDLSFIAHISPQRLLFRLFNPDTGEELAAYETGEMDPSDAPSASPWYQVGINYTVAEGVERIKLTIYNNSIGVTGNEFVIHDVEIRLCLESVTVADSNPACRKQLHVLEAKYDNYGILGAPEYRWSYSADNISWQILQTGPLKTYTIPVVHKSNEGWYRVSVADEGNSDNVHCRSESEPFRLSTTYCNTAVEQSVDTAVCDTLFPLSWRTHEWYGIGVLVDTIKDFEGDDSVHLTLSLDTFYCERLYPVVINKYNWLLLCDLTALNSFFGNTVIGYQWYKDGEPVLGATEDDYSEQNELHGSYQLVMTFADGSYVRSNVIDILDTPEPSPVRVQIYNSSGIPVREDQVSHGIYLFRYEQGERIWTEKKMIP